MPQVGQIYRVFWGVVESRSLVDIVNQTDLVEQPDEKTKMGQPMVHLTWSGDWGALELFGLTWHRPRTLPGRHGRLRAGLVVDHDLTTYESTSQEWHLDFAGRYGGSFGPLDVGLSVFDGTSREPTLLPSLVGSELVLAPHYEQILPPLGPAGVTKSSPGMADCRETPFPAVRFDSEIALLQ